MATITVPTYLDGGSARTAGEDMTINGGVLTVRTDTRVHDQAPASMAGTLGSQAISSSLGGGLIYDASAVRWLRYDTASGNVPPWGSRGATQGGIAGYILGFWADVTSAPAAVGAAVPASGYIKFREVTGGPFAAGAVSFSGGSVNALAADANGWIEVVCDANSTITVPRRGYHTIRGAWFYLDAATGSIGQVLNTPANGGGANSQCIGVWVETAAGSGIYEFWPSVTTNWLLTDLGQPQGGADIRQKVVKSLANGQIQFGESVADSAGSSSYATAGAVTTMTYTDHLLCIGQQVYLENVTGLLPTGVYTVASVPSANTYTLVENTTGMGSGTATRKMQIGHVPASGCKVRIPNVILREAATGTRAANNAITGAAGRTGWAVSAGGVLDFEYATSSWTNSFNFPYSVRMRNSILGANVSIVSCATALDIDTLGQSHCYYASGYNSLGAYFYNCKGTVANYVFRRGGAAASYSNDHHFYLENCTDINLTLNFAYLTVGTGLTQNGFGIYFYNCSGITVGKLDVIGPILAYTSVQFTNSDKILVSSFDFCRRISGVTYALGANNKVMALQSCKDAVIDGITAGKGGAIADVGNAAVWFALTTCTNVRVRNMGAAGSPVNAGSRSALYPRLLYYSGGGNTRCKFQRAYLSNWAGEANYLFYGCPLQPVYSSPFDSDSTFEHIYVNNASYTYYNNSVNENARAIEALPAAAPPSSRHPNYATVGILGSNFGDVFTSNTTGRIVLFAQEGSPGRPTTIEAGTPAFTGAAGLVCASVGDAVIFTPVYKVKGHTGFANAAATFTGTNQASHLVEYKIDTGSGYNAAWKTLNYLRTGGSTSLAFPRRLLVTDTTGVKTGDYVLGTGVGANAKVAVIVSATELTVDVDSTANGSSLTFTFSSLPGETISPGAGFLLKVRVTAVVASSSNLFSTLSLPTVTTLPDQNANLHDLDTVPMEINGLIAGSRIKVTKTSDGSLLVNDLSSGTVFNTSVSYTGEVRIEVRKASAAPFYKPWITVATVGTGLSVTALQVRDDT